MPVTKPVEERFWPRVVMGDWLDCWMWDGPTNAGGYGIFGLGRGSVLAHRVAYELLVGPIGEPTLDHTCHSELVPTRGCKGGPACPHRRCVNPLHLEPTTRRENALRGIVGPNRTYVRNSHCHRLHPLSGGNLYVDPAGGRHCRICRRDNLRAWRERQRG